MNIKCSVSKKIENWKLELANWNCIECHARCSMSRASGFAVVPTLDIDR